MAVAVAMPKLDVAGWLAGPKAKPKMDVAGYASGPTIDAGWSFGTAKNGFQKFMWQAVPLAQPNMAAKI